MQKPNQYILSITALICFLSFFSCCKDKTPPQQDLGHFSLDTTIKPYLYAKQGSWWVYKNDSTGEIDSQVMVSSVYQKVRTSNEVRTYTYDDIKTTIKSMTNGYLYNLGSYGSQADMYVWDFHVLYNRNRYKSGDFDGFEDVFSTTQVIGNEIGRGLFYQGKIPTMQLNGFTFYDVLKFEVKDDETWPDSNIPTSDRGTSIYYWAKNVGLIMIENGDEDQRYNPAHPITQKWEIINYYIQP